MTLDFQFDKLFTNETEITYHFDPQAPYASIWTYGPGRFLKKAEIRKTGRARPFLGVGPQYMGY